MILHNRSPQPEWRSRNNSFFRNSTNPTKCFQMAWNCLMISGCFSSSRRIYSGALSGWRRVVSTIVPMMHLRRWQRQIRFVLYWAGGGWLWCRDVRGCERRWGGLAFFDGYHFLGGYEQLTDNLSAMWFTPIFWWWCVIRIFNTYFGFR